MKKILSKIEVVVLYFKEHNDRTNLIGTVNGGTLRTINESSLHFRTFKVKHFFLNQWKKFLNWCEVKFFPEFKAPRFEKKPLGGTVEPEKPKEERIAYTYKQAVVVEKGFYKGLTGVVLKQSEMMGIPVDRYEVEIISKTGSEIVEIWGDTMKPIETKPSKKS